MHLLFKVTSKFRFIDTYNIDKDIAIYIIKSASQKNHNKEYNYVWQKFAVQGTESVNIDKALLTVTTNMKFNDYKL